MATVRTPGAPGALRLRTLLACLPMLAAVPVLAQSGGGAAAEPENSLYLPLVMRNPQGRV